MKTIYLILALLSCSGFAGNLAADDASSQPPRRIVYSSRSKVSIVKNAGTLKLQVNVPLGSIEVLVADDNGMPVFQLETTATTGDCILIDSMDWIGTYTVWVTDAEGTVICQEAVEYN